MSLIKNLNKKKFFSSRTHLAQIKNLSHEIKSRVAIYLFYVSDSVPRQQFKVHKMTPQHPLLVKEYPPMRLPFRAFNPTNPQPVIDSQPVTYEPIMDKWTLDRLTDLGSIKESDLNRIWGHEVFLEEPYVHTTLYVDRVFQELFWGLFLGLIPLGILIILGHLLVGLVGIITLIILDIINNPIWKRRDAQIRKLRDAQIRKLRDAIVRKLPKPSSDNHSFIGSRPYIWLFEKLSKAREDVTFHKGRFSPKKMLNLPYRVWVSIWFWPAIIGCVYELLTCYDPGVYDDQCEACQILFFIYIAVLIFDWYIRKKGYVRYD